MANQSPWLEILDKERVVKTLNHSLTTDVVVVGGGIAGVITAYFLLTRTDKKVVLIEADRIAHGATGHNAGHITTSLEVPVSYLISKYGEDMTRRSLSGLETAWDLIEDVLSRTNIRVHYNSFIGYGGYPTIEQLIVELENIRQFKLWGEVPKKVLVKDSFDFHEIPQHLHEFCEHVPAKKVNEILKIQSDNHYIAAVPEKMAVMNSAHFTEEIVKWCLKEYQDRFQLYEKSPLTLLDAHVDSVIAHVGNHTVTAQESVLCTNGFERFSVKNEGVDIDTRFHHEVHGRIGYMAGFSRKEVYEPMAHWYMREGTKFSYNMDGNDPYYYMTRRPFYFNHTRGIGLLAIGGPEAVLSDRGLYDRQKEIDKAIKDEIVEFVRKTVGEERELKETFFWHGLMGYTTSGLRLIGPDPCNKRIMYNLGCNGIGITTSIFGGSRIAHYVNKELVEPMIFDPGDSRCMVTQPIELLSKNISVP